MLRGQVSEQKDVGTLDKIKMLREKNLARLQILHFVLLPTICPSVLSHCTEAKCKKVRSSAVRCPVFVVVLFCFVFFLTTPTFALPP